MTFTFLKNNTTRDPHHIHELHIYKDWLWVVFVFTVGFVCVALIHIVIFQKMETVDDLDGENIISQTKTINRTELKRAVDELNRRSIRFNELRKLPASAVDPSL